MVTLFPFLISYTNVSNFILGITSGVAVSTDIMVIAWLLINFMNIWFIITIAKIIIRIIKKIIKVIY